MFVRDYMTPEPLVVSQDEPVERIAELIRLHGILQVPVVNEANRLVGIVTDRDIRSAGRSEAGGGRVRLLVRDIMTRSLVTTTPGTGLLDAAYILLKHPFGALPVVKGDFVVGMLTLRNLLHRLIELLEEGEAGRLNNLRSGSAGVHGLTLPPGGARTPVSR